MRVLGICAAVALMLAALAPAPGRAMVPEDILSIRTTQVVDLSPDGRYLLYAVGTWNQKAASWQQTVFRRDLDTGDDLVVFTPEDRSRGAVFRPDGRAIAYLRQGDAGSEIWAMAADGSDRKRLSTGGGLLRFPALGA